MDTLLVTDGKGQIKTPQINTVCNPFITWATAHDTQIIPSETPLLLHSEAAKGEIPRFMHLENPGPEWQFCTLQVTELMRGRSTAVSRVRFDWVYVPCFCNFICILPLHLPKLGRFMALTKSQALSLLSTNVMTSCNKDGNIACLYTQWQMCV